MHSDAATIGVIVQPVAGSATAHGPVTVVGDGVGATSATARAGDASARPARRHFARSRSRWEKLPVYPRSYLLKQLSAANAPFRPTAR
jgi:hypothetical protein